MVASILDGFGRARAFELLDFLILFFVLFSIVTLLFLVGYEIRSRRALRRANARVARLVTYLGRNVYGERGWHLIENAVNGSAARLDSLISVLEPEQFEKWAQQATKEGRLEDAQVDELKERLSEPVDLPNMFPGASGVTECVPTTGMLVAVQQSGVEIKGTIAGVSQSSIRVWILEESAALDSTRAASFLLLSRSGPYSFEAHFEEDEDGSLLVERPARIVRSQRRRFGRHPAALPVTVRSYLSDDPPLEALINELSGGGATLTNPFHTFEAGDVLEMSFAVGSRRYTVAGRVIRSSGEGRRLHVRFEAMKDQQREDIALSVAVTELS